MAVLSVRNPTLLDLAKATDPDGQVATVVEILNEVNELGDMTFMEGNLPTGNRTVIRSGIPTPTWRKMYGGVQPAKSTLVTVTDNCGMLEAYAEVDKDLADLSGNPAAFRMLEDAAWLEGIAQEFADTLFYGNEGTEPEAFTGLSPRFNDTTAENGDNIILGGGAGADNASIWLVVWGPRTVHGIVPKSSTAGVKVTDKGVVTLEDASDGSNTGRMEAYRTHYQMKAGLTVRDWRFIVRICNIDKSLLTNVFTAGAFSSGANLPSLMFRAMRKIPNLNAGRPVFYMSRDTATWVAEQASASVHQSTLTRDNLGGDEGFTERFHGIPIRRVDALAADEALVS